MTPNKEKKIVMMPASLLVKILVYSLSKTLCLRLVGDDSGVLELVLLVKAEVEGTDDRIGIVDGNGADIGKGLDLGSAVKSFSSILGPQNRL